MFSDLGSLDLFKSGRWGSPPGLPQMKIEISYAGIDPKTRSNMKNTIMVKVNINQETIS